MCARHASSVPNADVQRGHPQSYVTVNSGRSCTFGRSLCVGFGSADPEGGSFISSVCTASPMCSIRCCVSAARSENGSMQHPANRHSNSSSFTLHEGVSKGGKCAGRGQIALTRFRRKCSTASNKGYSNSVTWFCRCFRKLFSSPKRASHSSQAHRKNTFWSGVMLPDWFSACPSISTFVCKALSLLSPSSSCTASCSS